MNPTNNNSPGDDNYGRDKKVMRMREEWESYKADITKRMNEAESIELAAEIRFPFVTAKAAGYSYRDAHNYAAGYERSGFIAGANWQKSQSGLVEKAKVVEMIEKTIKVSTHPKGRLQESSAGWNNALENILDQINSL